MIGIVKRFGTTIRISDPISSKHPAQMTRLSVCVVRIFGELEVLVLIPVAIACETGYPISASVTVS